VAPSTVVQIASASTTEVPVIDTMDTPVPPTSLASPAPLCEHRDPPSWIDQKGFPADGPDLSGRIFFGQSAHQNGVLGQIVGPLFAIDPDGSDLVQVFDCKIQRPRVSPDGTRLAFSIVMDDGTLQVATANIDGSGLRILTSTSGFAETPDWSPDGSWLIYSQAPQPCATGTGDDCALQNDRRYSLWRMDADGDNQQRIGDSNTLGWEPRLSPDGHAVVFETFDFEDEMLRLVLRELDTGRERSLAPAAHEPEHPDWSPDGQWIIYNRTGCRTCEQVERVPADNLDAQPEVLYLAGGTHDGYKPVYAPDGSRIVFGCEGRVCVMDADGSNVEVLVSAPATILNHFDWGAAAPT